MVYIAMPNSNNVFQVGGWSCAEAGMVISMDQQI